MPCYNRARISNFCLEFQKLQKYCRNYRFLQNATPPSVLIQSFWNFTGETRHIVSPCNKARISNFCLEFQKLQKLQISLKCYSSLFDHSEIFTGETRHIVPPYNKAGISNFFCLEFQKLQKLQIFSKRYSSFSSYSIILNFLLEKLGI